MSKIVMTFEDNPQGLVIVDVEVTGADQESTACNLAHRVGLYIDKIADTTVEKWQEQTLPKSAIVMPVGFAN